MVKWHLCSSLCSSESIPNDFFILRCNYADVENGLEDTGRGKGKLGRSERVAWTYIHYQL